jgi:hypothetical protein
MTAPLGMAVCFRFLVCYNIYVSAPSTQGVIIILEVVLFCDRDI